MTTATPTKTKSALFELDRLEAGVNRAKELTRRLDGELSAKGARYRDLTDERQRLVYRQPDLVDHLGAPVDDDNAVASVDKEIAGLGDLNDLAAQAAHAQELENKAQQDVGEFIRGHFDQLVEDWTPFAQALADKVNEADRACREANQDYIGGWQRMASWVHAARGDTRCIPGLEAASAAVKSPPAAMPAPVPR